MKPQTRTVAIINDSKILVIENGEKLVPIKPICDALGIQYPSQKEKIEGDEILGPTVRLSRTVAADGKDREMFCIPLKYVFGWLFTINPSNVKEEAREAVVKYKEACYDALYRTFTDASEFLTEKQRTINQLIDEQKAAKKNFQEANKKLKEAEKALDEAVGMSFDLWIANNRQMKIFEEGKEENND